MVGREECDVLAGAFLRPRGSFRPCARSKTEPGGFVRDIAGEKDMGLGLTGHLYGLLVIQHAHIPRWVLGSGSWLVRLGRFLISPSLFGEESIPWAPLARGFLLRHGVCEGRMLLYLVSRG